MKEPASGWIFARSLVVPVSSNSLPNLTIYKILVDCHTIPGEIAQTFNPGLLKAIARKGFTVPTPIQRKTVPLILDGTDVVGMARTGSGKTAACQNEAIASSVGSKNNKQGVLPAILPAWMI